MNILILNWKDIRNPDVGGAEIILYELAKRMVKDGHIVTWFCRAYEGGTISDSYDGIHVIRRGNKYSVYAEAFLYYRSLRVKPDKVFDCVNTICWQTPLYVPKEKRIAYVNQLAREVLMVELPPVISHIAFALEPLEYQTYHDTKFLCYSESVKTDISTFGIPLRNIATFPIGIDHKRYVPGEKSADPLFLFVARLGRMKRPDLCVEAMRTVSMTYPKAKLAIVGYGPMEQSLQDMIARYNLQKNVFLVNKDALFFDTTPKDKKVKLMQEAWALLLPSVKEGWGMVVTEAAACGTPCIGTEVTGLRDSILHNTTGLLLSASPTVSQLAGAIMKIISQKQLRVRLSKEAITEATRFTWDSAYTKFVNMIG